MLASGIEILEFIPQRSPMVMIDKLLFSNNEKTVSGLSIDEDCIFCENGHLSESGLVENIAQTAAAGVGYLCKMENKKVPIGFIASIKNLNVFHLPHAKDELRTEVTIINEVMDVTIINGTVHCKEILMAECEMRIFIKPD